MNISSVIEEEASVEECRRIFDSLPFLWTLTEDHIQALAALSRIRSFEQKATLFHEDEKTDAVYLISEGEVEVYSSTFQLGKLPLVTLRGSGLLGEMGLLNNTPRTATAQAVTPVRTLCFKAADFNQALQSDSLPAYHMVLAFAQILAQRLSVMNQRLFDSNDQSQALVALISGGYVTDDDFWSRLVADIKALASIASTCNFKAGTVIFHEGDETDAVYLIVSGEVEVFKGDPSRKKLPLAVLHGRGLVGEVGLLNNSPRTATARALTPVRALCFRATDFNQALDSDNLPAFHLVLAFARVLAQRVSEMDQRLSVISQEVDPDDREQINDVRQQLRST